LILNANCEQIIGQNAVQAVRIREGNSAPRDIACQGMFIFVGMRPSTGFIQNLLKKNEFGYIITDEVCATGVPGVFACGDCVQVPLRQVITACGKGAVAAYAVRKFLESMDNGEKAVSA
jgi:Thioredoxin reductase